jgi:hypothetical protein
MDSRTILKTFNDHFEEFVNDVVNVFPDNKDVLTTRTALTTIRKANPKLIIKCWKEYVSVPYAREIEDGDLAFFIDKDYTKDLKDLDGNDAIMQKIDRLRAQVRSMTTDDQEKSMKYVQNLTKLANLYQ